MSGEYLLIYNKKYKEEIETWKLGLSRDRYYIRKDDEFQIDKIYIEDICNNNIYYILEESDALKYYGGSCFYINHIYCTDDVDNEAIYKLYKTCIRRFNPITDIGLSNFDFKQVK